MDSLKWIGFQILRKMKGRKPKRYENSDSEEISLPEESVEYDFITIQNATNNFSKKNRIGEGGFGVVYKGTLKNGQQVAVKRLSKNLKGGSQEFKNEVSLMVKFQHRNLVKLLGFSLEGKEVFLVYEFVPNGSLDNFLYGSVKHKRLGWERRYKIIECIARGLVYLHEGSLIRIIHCNLKASNVLLDEDLNPKIVDFDMAKLFALDKIHDSTSRIMRTRYIAPEYTLQGEISIKTDVYSFGMLILEIISGHRISNFQNEESTNDDELLSYAWTHWKGGSASNVIDPMLRGIKSPVDEITKCIHIALLCVQESVADRPKMIEVLQMLNKLSIRLPEPLEPGLFIRGSISSEASSQFTKNVKSISDQYDRKMQKKKAKSYVKTVEESSSSVEINPVESHLKYELITIQNATNNFSKANKLGEGGYWPIYKGKLENGLEVAVRRLPKYGNLEFKNEVTLIAKLQHRNLVRLFGYCQEGREMILVYEFLPNGGLDGFLFDPIKCGYLNWERRYKIIEGIGKGLVYLHEDSRLRIAHRDVKARSILLDADLNPKLADFGLAWSFALDETESSSPTGIVGTYGYIAPEYYLNGEFSIKTDVYSFGVLVLEIITGQNRMHVQNEGTTTNLLSSYAWKQWTNGSSSNLIHPMLRGISSPVNDIIKCIQIALLCIQVEPEDRPTMSEVVQMLSNLSMSIPVPLAPPELAPPGLDDDCSTVCSEGSINEMSVSEDDEYLR
ncbi:cysteine-rich receptor-like protein kinase 13 isoform X2 [Ipomoea triloba]|uniref:cysteine-rich receptor-like protein kinase 13 isoform X2 n=1 Tax=Ipomoea triloba TaxID=35885 RepID=UPI00125E8FA4|nr:cysteine-rich receptor-like protein kinase 13 isoform X2 [Ipomoea triloba]